MLKIGCGSWQAPDHHRRINPSRDAAVLLEWSQHINLISTSCFIYETITKNLSNFKNVHKYMSHYQVSFNKFLSLLIKTSSYTKKSIQMYFQATIFMNIWISYLAIVSAIQKNLKNKTPNMVEVVLQIIRYLEFREENKKVNNALQRSSSTTTTNCTPKDTYINPECIVKRLTTTILIVVR